MRELNILEKGRKVGGVESLVLGEVGVEGRILVLRWDSNFGGEGYDERNVRVDGRLEEVLVGVDGLGY